MIIKIALAFGINLDKNTAKHQLKILTDSLSVGAAIEFVGKIAANALKLIPGVDIVICGAISASVAGSSTKAIRKNAIEFYSSLITDEKFKIVIFEIHSAIHGFNALKTFYENKHDYIDLD